MELTSAVALARDGCSTGATRKRRGFASAHCPTASSASYLDAEWPEVAYCVGVFRMEGRGVQLFDSVEGDHFAILGMPLIALLGALRERGLIGA